MRLDYSFTAIIGCICAILALPVLPPEQQVLSDVHADIVHPPPTPKDAQVLILGGGVSGIIAARTLHQQGISNVIIVEARDELGGRMRSHSFGSTGNTVTVEVGANWVHGTQTEDGPVNPMWELAKKHQISTQSSAFLTSISTSSFLYCQLLSWTLSFRSDV